MLLAVVAVVQARVARGVLPGHGHMPQQLLHECWSGHALGLQALVAVVLVGEADVAVVVEFERSAARQWAASGVACEVQHDALGVFVGWADLYVPVPAAPQPLEDGLPVSRVGSCGQLPAVAQAVADALEQRGLVAQPQRGQRREPVHAGVTPAALRVDAAGADQAVHVRVVRQVAAPGVQALDDAGQRAEDALVGKHFEQR